MVGHEGDSNYEMFMLNRNGLSFDRSVLGFATVHGFNGSGFKGYNRLKLETILIKTWNNQHNPLGETVLREIEDKNPLIVVD